MTNGFLNIIFDALAKTEHERGVSLKSKFCVCFGMNVPVSPKPKASSLFF